jgi:DnaJ like chaperone protein
MSIWSRIADSVRALAAGEPLTAVLERLSRPPEHTVAFTIAVIALSAKMAKADGLVTRSETAAARIYNTARSDVAGYDIYARQIARMFRDRPGALVDLLEGLVYIAVSDGEYHPAEAAFLEEVARIFGISDAEFRSIRARHEAGAPDPYAVLGLSHAASDAEVRQRYRSCVRDLHPDQMHARGFPPEARRLAEQRLAKINAAYQQIRQERAAVA